MFLASADLHLPSIIFVATCYLIDKFVNFLQVLVTDLDIVDMPHSRHFASYTHLTVRNAFGASEVATSLFLMASATQAKISGNLCVWSCAFAQKYTFCYCCVKLFSLFFAQLCRIFVDAK